jgi:hypothetical protein
MIFEVLGYDFLLDTEMQPWLLEINHGPNLEPHTDLENDIKACMIHDALQTVDVTRTDAARLAEETDALWNALQTRLQNGETLSDFGGLSADKITRGDIYTFLDAELELERRGSFEPLFHQGNSEFYSQFLLPGSRSTRLALHAWAAGQSVGSWIGL